jgi:hypothetical protein
MQLLVSLQRSFTVSATEKAINRILFKHPWLSYDYAKRMAEDLKRRSWSSPQGRRAYNREYQRLRRAEKKGEVKDVPGVVTGKYLRKKHAHSNEAKTGFSDC